ncbi:MAG: MerR family transcriptional regulator [Gemmatimonadales bacterium]
MTQTKQYTLCELARVLGLPESTARYYRDTFAPHVPWVGSSARRRYPEKALETLRLISDAYASGYTREQIESLLDSEYPAPSGGASPALPNSAHHPPGNGYERLATAIVESEREQRELMWQMVREITRFGDVIERQQQILVELVQQSLDRSGQALIVGAGEAETVADEDVLDVELEEEHDRMQDPSQQCDSSAQRLSRLEEELSKERDLVERLRRSRLELERRAAAAEERLSDVLERPGLIDRLLNRYGG